jgi:wobble nucleotide-excising tRNase
MVNHSLQGEIVNVKIENDKLRNENDELKAQLKRAKVYLKATSDLLQKQNESHYVLNLLETTVFYDEADCDGYCLKDEIDTFLEMGD